MDWLTVLRLALIAAAFYVLLPTWGSPVRDGRFAVACVRFSLFVSFSVGLLGLVGLALPGTVLTLSFVWIGCTAIPHLQNWREAIARILERVRCFRWPRFHSSPGWAALTVVFIATAWIPVTKMGLSPDQLERASSLAVLSNGHLWTLDTSVLLLLPLQWLSAIPAPRIIALIDPVVACAFVLAVEFAVSRAANSPTAAALSLRAAAGVQIWIAFSQLEYRFAAHLGGFFVLLLVGLWATHRKESLMSGMLGSALFWTLPSLESLEMLVPSFACVALGIGFSRYAERWLHVASRVSLAALVVGVLLVGVNAAPPAQSRSEAAARLALGIGADRPRNSWMLVSTAQEAPFVYGRGWHMDIAQFAGEVDALPVHEAQFRFTYPVRELYVFLEPNPAGSAEHIAAEFRAAHRLATYAAAHPDVETLHQGPDLLAYRIAIQPALD